MSDMKTLEDWIEFSKQHDERWAKFCREKDDSWFKYSLRQNRSWLAFTIAMTVTGIIIGFMIGMCTQ